MAGLAQRDQMGVPLAWLWLLGQEWAHAEDVSRSGWELGAPRLGDTQGWAQGLGENREGS